MRFEAVRMHNVGPFADVDIDLFAIDAELVAVTGPNGAGKSTFLELLPGTAYRQCPTRGALAGLATARDSWTEVRVHAGQTYTIRQHVDAVSGKGEAVVLDAAGQPLTHSGKVTEVTKWVREHLIPESVLYASTFAVQGSGGFVELKPSDRKAVLLRALGIERLEAMAKRARERAREAQQDVDMLRARMRDERERGGDVEKARHEMDEAKAYQVGADEELVAARKALEEAQAAQAAYEEAQRKAAELRSQRHDMERQRKDAAEQLSDVERRIANNRRVLEQSEEIREAEAEAAELRSQIEKAREEERLVQGELSRQDAVVETFRRDVDAHERALQDARQRCSRAADRLVGKPAVDAAVQQLAGQRDTVATAQKSVQEREQTLEEARGVQLAGAEERITGLRRGLSEIAQADADFEQVTSLAQDTLDTDDQMVENAAEAPKRIEEAKGALEEAQREFRTAEERLRETERLAMRADEMAEMERELRSAGEQADESGQLVIEARNALETAAHGAEEMRAAAETHRAATATAQARLDELAPTLKLAEPLSQARARLEEREPQAARLRDQIADIDGRLAELPERVDVPEPPDVNRARTRTDAAEKDCRTAATNVALASQRLHDAEKAAERLATLETDLRAAEREVQDWTRLGQDLGRDGLQALEIDAAGPELTALVNDLLHTCVGPRWTVTIETTRASADGKKQIEGCDVRVLDVEKGRDAPIETFSGGERVLLGEAIALGLSTLACRRSGVERPTLTRDESGAALDPANGRAYIAMLRRAGRLVGADKTLFVSHDPSLQALADTCIRVGEGTARTVPVTEDDAFWALRDAKAQEDAHAA